ncbi:hypothetical protein OROHE_010093 [Orobanche hederae]
MMFCDVFVVFLLGVCMLMFVVLHFCLCRDIEMVLYDMELASGDNDIQELSGSKYQADSNAIPLVFHGSISYRRL